MTELTMIEKPVLKNLLPAHVEIALDEDRAPRARAFSLGIAFDWYQHPRGSEWWQTAFATLSQTGHLSVEAQTELKALL